MVPGLLTRPESQQPGLVLRVPAAESRGPKCNDACAAVQKTLVPSGTLWNSTHEPTTVACVACESAGPCQLSVVAPARPTYLGILGAAPCKCRPGGAKKEKKPFGEGGHRNGHGHSATLVFVSLAWMAKKYKTMVTSVVSGRRSLRRPGIGRGAIVAPAERCRCYSRHRGPTTTKASEKLATASGWTKYLGIVV